jgi:hypothetical protein
MVWMKVVSFKRSSLKREVRRFSTNSARPPLPPSCESPLNLTCASLLIGCQLKCNWQQRTKLFFYIMQRLAKVQWTFEICSQRHSELFLIFVLNLSTGRGAMNAICLLNFRHLAGVGDFLSAGCYQLLLKLPIKEQGGATGKLYYKGPLQDKMREGGFCQKPLRLSF